MEFFLLGPVRASVAGRPVNIGVRKQRLLLAVLCLEVNQEVGTERLIRLLWPQGPPPTARGMVHTYVSGLRTTLAKTGAADHGIRIERGRSGYVLRCDPGRIDVHRFRALAAEARAGSDDEHRVTLLGRALALWRGPALTGAGDEQARAQLAGGLEESRLNATEDLVEARLRLGRHHAVLHELLALVAEHPNRPRLTGALMLALHRAGRTADALEVYQAMRRRLREDLGLDPPPELRELHVAMLRGDPGLAAGQGAGPGPGTGPAEPAPRQLPADLTTFTGRNTELDQLERDSLAGDAPPAVVISAIDGMAGVGKTALAVHAAHRLASRFPDGQLFVDLHGFTQGMAPVDPVDALDGMLRGLGVPGEQIPPSGEGRAALYRTRLADKRMLILLDNAVSEGQVRPLLPGAPGCLVLITSRVRLTDLDDVRPLSLDVLPLEDAVILFTRIAGHDHPRHLVAEIAELCGRLPLAVRTAAARLRSRPGWTAAHLAQRLRDHEHRLAELHAGRRSVSVAIDLSYHQLDPPRQRLYRFLSLPPGPDIDAYAAAALAGTALAETVRLLDDLVDEHLLEEPAAGRFRFHDLLRAHAAQAAAREETEPERRAALTRLLDHYTHTASFAMNVVYPHDADNLPRVCDAPGPTPDIGEKPRAAAWLDDELTNLLAAAHCSGHGKPHHTLRLSTILHRHLRTRADYTRAAELHSHALRTAREMGDRTGEIEASWRLGYAEWFKGNYALAEASFRQALETADATGHRTGALNALHGLGHIYLMQGQHETAADCYRQALEHARGIGHQAGELEARWGLGHIHRLLVLPDEAAEHFERAVQIARTIGHHEGELNALYGLGHVRRLQARNDAALDCYQQALDIAYATGDRVGEATALRGLGHIQLKQGLHGRAADSYERALDAARATGHRFSEVNALRGLGHAHLRQGLHDKAEDDFRRSLDLALIMGDLNGRLLAQHALGLSCQAHGKPDEALAHHQAALDLARELAHPSDEVNVLHGLARTHRDLGDHQQARALWRQALVLLGDLPVAQTEEISADEIRAHLAALPD
ncbi:tetratricopeptide repeat protein [Actinomadura fulvescens]|uniref:BTAD domain-containing putative transcriptional regulator n=1 Tax=Actinomadura fulvescens TaxID=46160 RepID=A0ABN3PKS8_9ACTN